MASLLLVAAPNKSHFRDADWNSAFNLFELFLKQPKNDYQGLQFHVQNIDCSVLSIFPKKSYYSHLLLVLKHHFNGIFFQCK